MAAVTDVQAASHPQPYLVTSPDPSVATTEQLNRAVIGERDYVDGQILVLRERLGGIDVATELRLAGIEGIPSQIDEKVGHLAEVMAERFNSVATQFLERDTRQEREARDNKVAVDAAFAAQKEAAAEQNKSNTLAIDKSEAATTETINKLAELFKSTTDSLADKLDDWKESTSRQIRDAIDGAARDIVDVKARQAVLEARILTVEVNKSAATEVRTERRDDKASTGQSIGLYLVGASVVIGLIALIVTIIATQGT